MESSTRSITMHCLDVLRSIKLSNGKIEAGRYPIMSFDFSRVWEGGMDEAAIALKDINCCVEVFVERYQALLDLKLNLNISDFANPEKVIHNFSLVVEKVSLELECRQEEEGLGRLDQVKGIIVTIDEYDTPA